MPKAVLPCGIVQDTLFVVRQHLHELVILKIVDFGLVPRIPIVHLIALRTKRRESVAPPVGKIDGILIISLQIVNLHDVQGVKQQVQTVLRNNRRFCFAPIFAVPPEDGRNAVPHRMQPIFKRRNRNCAQNETHNQRHQCHLAHHIRHIPLRACLRQRASFPFT